MNIIISNSSNEPIYEQIKEQIKNKIVSNELKTGDLLPSIRNLAKDLRISVITTKSAYEELEKVEGVSSEPVNPDWMLRFFNSVEDISDEGMQKIWSHILAGEIKKPNSYSYRTLEKLKNMTQQEAEHFQIVSSLALQTGNVKFILEDKELMNKYDVYFTYLLELEECGLMSAQTLSLTLQASSEQADIIYNSRIVGMIKGKEETLKKMKKNEKYTH